MNGIEIAGLLLGAFPILVGVLKTYREGAETVNDWWRIETSYKKTWQDLNYHRILFEGNVERFLLPLVADDDELAELMGDPAGKAWENAELEAYEVFLDIIVDISNLVDNLKKELGAKGKFAALVIGNGKLDKANVMRGELLKTANERMRKLLESSDQTAVARQRGVSKASYMINK
ncbi:hypothetical protein ACEQ8H_005707 [Pleosporales sp. CAS-2024a]